MKRQLLGIDIGSSAVKAALFTLEGQQVAASRVPCPSPGEFDPERWWTASVEAVRQLDTESVAAAGVCGRGGTCVLLDRDSRPVAPSWHDARSAETAVEVRARNPSLEPQAVTLLAKARWWELHNGHCVASAVSAKDFVSLRLTGVLGSDPASGGDTVGHGTPLVEARAPWSLLGVTGDGGVLPAGIPVATGWHDGAAAAFGAGAAELLNAPATLGTTAVYRVVTDALPSGLRKYWDLTPGLTVTGGDITGAGRAYGWAKDLFRDADASRSQPGARGVVFLPQFAGRIAPHRSPDARAAWLGMTGEQTADDLLRAVIEGTAYSLRQVRDWLAGEGLTARRIVATGGGSRNPVQVQVLADVLGEPVEVTSIEEGCRGAALLGAVAAGCVDLEEARTLRPGTTVVNPGASTHRAYADGFGRFLAAQAASDLATGATP